PLLMPAAGTAGALPLSFIPHPLPLSDVCRGRTIRSVGRAETLCMHPVGRVGSGWRDPIPRFRSLCCFARMEAGDRTTPTGQVTRATRAERDRSTAASVLAHPVRVRVLEILNQRDMSPIEFCREGFAPNDMDVSHVAYHFRELAEYGCLTVVEENKRRGSIEHVYRAIGRAYFSDSDWAALEPDERIKISKAIFQGLLARADEAFMAKTFETREDR